MLISSNITPNTFLKRCLAQRNTNVHSVRNATKFLLPDNGKYFFNPFKLNGVSHHFQLLESISNFRVVVWYFSFLFAF